MPEHIPFCFRCGGEPKYQLELRVRDQGVSGPFWPLCTKCFMEIPWERVLRDTVQGMEEQEAANAP